jgi:hypothetical protein
MVEGVKGDGYPSKGEESIRGELGTNMLKTEMARKFLSED